MRKLLVISAAMIAVIGLCSGCTSGKKPDLSVSVTPTSTTTTTAWMYVHCTLPTGLSLTLWYPNNCEDFLTLLSYEVLSRNPTIINTWASAYTTALNDPGGCVPSCAFARADNSFTGMNK